MSKQLLFFCKYVIVFACTMLYTLCTAFQVVAQTMFTTSVLNENTLRLKTSFSNLEAFGNTGKLHTITLTNGMAYISQGKSRGSIEISDVHLPLENVVPFLCFSVKLRMNAGDANNAHIFVRSLDDTDVALSEWTYLPFDHHGEGAEGENGTMVDAKGNFSGVLTSNLAFLPKETRRVQLRIELQRTILQKEPILQGLELFAYNPTATPTETLTRLQASKNKAFSNLSEITIPKKNAAEQYGNSYPRPAFVSRTEWGCPWGQTSGPNTLTPTTPTHLIVHHSFSPGNNVTDWVAAVRGIWSYHVMSNGWSDIGYNWLIDPNGNIYEGRAWVGSDDNTQGAHFCGFNRNTMGICMLGDFTSITPTDAALKSLVRILAYRASTNNIDVRSTSLHTNSMRTLNNISGHRDGCSTECPGESLYPLLPSLRNRVYALLNPPSVAIAMPSVTNRDAAQVSATVRGNGSETQVFVEWGDARTVPAPTASNYLTTKFPNRRLVQTLSATTTAEVTIATVLTGLDPTLRYAVRFSAENSDTSAVTTSREFTTMQTSVQTPHQSLLAGTEMLIAPNPSFGTAHVWYRLQGASNVSMQLVAPTGHVISTFVNAEQSAGEYRTPIPTDNLPNGVYYCRLVLHNSTTGEITRAYRAFVIVK